MKKRKKFEGNDPFIRKERFITDQGKVITQGDFIRIKGVSGTQFKFLNYVTNPTIGVSWVDCVELERGLSCSLRSFYPERVKHIPKKREKRVK